MLKNINPIISPQLLKILAEMGHGDELVIGDANFAAQSLGRQCVRADGHSAVELVDAILDLLPLDTFVDSPVILMQPAPGVLSGDPPVWEKYRKVVDAHQEKIKFSPISVDDFYERTKKAYATVSTAEREFYACAILRKGVI